MALTRTSVMWHVGSMAAGGVAVFTAMASQQIDVYAVWNAMNKVVADVTTLLGLLAPIAAIFGTAYRTWNAKQVPKDTVAMKPETIDHGPTAATAIVTGKIVGALLIGFLVLSAASSAYAQTRKPQITGNIIADIKANTGPGAPSPSRDLIALYDKLQAVSLIDLKYALNIANKKNNMAAGQCWTAIITQIEQDQTANLDANGQPLPTPDPHLFTDVERLSDVINSLGPNSPLMVGCGSFANQAKMNVLQLISTILAGGAGLAAFAP